MVHSVSLIKFTQMLYFPMLLHYLAKQGNTKIRLFGFHSNAALLQLPNFNQSALDIYNLVDSQFILVLLPEINGNQF